MVPVKVTLLYPFIAAGGLTEAGEDGTEDFSKNREMRQARVEGAF